ncbi:MAG: NUDIX hydrolase [Candidatus Promineifilaceae bacterium]|jgi:ADP-ribose pyrophosphatase
MEKWVTRQKIYEGRIFDVQGGEAMLDDGRLVHREVVTHDGGVGVVPVLGEQVLLIRQYRIAVDEFILEIPAGRREGQEPPQRRAELELKEETGYQAAEFQLLTTYYSSAGFTNERMFIFLATGLQEGDQALEADEEIEILPIALAEIPRMLAEGEIVDAKTIIGLRELLARPDFLTGAG